MSIWNIFNKTRDQVASTYIDNQIGQTGDDWFNSTNIVIENKEKAVEYYKDGLRSNDIQTQIKCFNDAIRLDPNYVEAVYSLAMAYKRSGDRAEAIHNLEIAYNINKVYQDICKQLAYNTFYNKLYYEAITYFMDAICYTKYEDEMSEMYAHLAFCYYNIDNIAVSEKTTNVVNSLISSYSLDPLVSTRLHRNTYTDEIWFEVIEKSFNYDSNIHSSREEFLADKYWRHGLRVDDEKTKTTYIKKAIEIKPDHHQSHYSLGCYYKKNNQVIDAIFHFLQTEKFSPGYEDTRKILHGLIQINSSSAELSMSLIDFNLKQLEENKTQALLISSQQIKIEQIKHLQSGLTDLCQNQEIDIDDLKRDNKRLNSELTAYTSKYNELRIKLEGLKTKQSLSAASSSNELQNKLLFSQPMSSTYLKMHAAKVTVPKSSKSKYLNKIEQEQNEVFSSHQSPEQSNIYEDIKI